MECARTFAALNESERREFWAALALRHAEGIGGRSIKKLLLNFGSAYDAVHASHSWGQIGLGDKAVAINSGRWRESAQQEWQAAQLCDADILLWTDEEYPQRLREIVDAPVLLYTRGDRSLLKNSSIALVGSRLCTREGVRVAGELAAGLASRGISVVSGLAKGIDRAAHVAALPHPGRTVAVLGTGIDIIYPERNADLFLEIRESGLLISEFSPRTPALASNFPVRNRLISGLSWGVVVVEASARSGSLITARIALEQNRDVYAIPGAAGMQSSYGCQELIRQGARPVFRADDIIEDLALLLRTDLNARPAVQAEISPCIQSNFFEKLETPSLVQTPKAEPKAQPRMQPRMQTVESQPLQGSLVRSLPPKKDARVAPSASSFPPVPPAPAPASPTADNTAFTRVLTVLDDSPVHIDSLSRSLRLDSAELGSVLIQLEVQGRIRRLPGMFYVRT